MANKETISVQFELDFSVPPPMKAEPQPVTLGEVIAGMNTLVATIQQSPMMQVLLEIDRTYRRCVAKFMAKHEVARLRV